MELVGVPQCNSDPINTSFLPVHICCQQVFAGTFIIVIIMVPCLYEFLVHRITNLLIFINFEDLIGET